MKDKLSASYLARRYPRAVCAAWFTACVLAALSSAGVVPALAKAVPAQPQSNVRSTTADPTLIEANLDRFLDRLMQAESAGIDTAKNPRSTALGPFQFIESTFLDLVEREFAEETRMLGRADILRLRTDRLFARRVARVYVRDSAEMLMENGERAGYGNLRLAYLLGTTAALQVLKARDEAPVANILGRAVVKANPFLARMSAERLAQWSASSIGEDTLPGGSVEAVQKNTRPAATPSKLSARRAKPSETSKQVRLEKRAVDKKLAATKPRTAKLRAARVKGRAMAQKSI